MKTKLRHQQLGAETLEFAFVAIFISPYYLVCLSLLVHYILGLF